MTLKTSFFNKGIYKSGLKRYIWGAILYFVILFMFTGMSVFLNVDMNYTYRPVSHYDDNPLILTDSYIVIPMLLAIAVPTIAAVLIFRFLHSKNQSVYIHSLPVSRKANFISQIAAAFTLMYIPIILNTVILMVISLCGYGDYFSIQDCLTWALCNMYIIFLMFSCTVLAATLTGNTAGMIGVNILIHSFLLIFVSTLGIMAEEFIYGYTSDNIILDTIMENNFVTVSIGMTSRYYRENMDIISIAQYLGASVIMFAASFWLYTKRQLENVGDVAGFGCLNIVFKYALSFIATMATFAIFSSYMQRSPFVFAAIIIIASVIAYVASEMILKKTLKIWYSWKGFIAYAICMGLVFSLFYFTTFFGYETRVPLRENIDKVAVTNILHKYTYTDNKDIIDITLNTHKEITAKGQIPKYNHDDYNYDEEYSYMELRYTLKDGSELKRRYLLKGEKCREIMNLCYEVDEYKQLAEEIFTDDSLISGAYMYTNDRIILDKNEIIPLLREDIMKLRYDEIYPIYNSTETMNRYYIEMQYIRNGNPSINNGGTYMQGAAIFVNEKYEKTYAYLMDKGYVPNH